MELSATEVRILGALVEKQATTPDVYPLSLNALTNACNQTTNRDPVMELTEDAIRWAVNNLRQQSMVRAIQRADARVMKFEHLLREKLQVDGAELAMLCVLMLRGPQTTGEIKGRSGRLHEFASLAEVDETLRTLMTRSLVVEVPRRPGQKEARFAHTLSPVAETSASTTHDAPPVMIVERAGSDDDRIRALESTVDQLKGELAALQSAFDEFKRQF
ncbi:MAG TPA: YceH family protein [Gemmatimonadaceae bacterium]|jgi:hypothetical protein